MSEGTLGSKKIAIAPRFNLFLGGDAAGQVDVADLELPELAPEGREIEMVFDHTDVSVERDGGWTRYRFKEPVPCPAGFTMKFKMKPSRRRSLKRWWKAEASTAIPGFDTMNRRERRKAWATYGKTP